METYLVEYKMFRAGKVIKEDIEQVDAMSEFWAKVRVEEKLEPLCRRATIVFGDVVQV